MLTSMYRNTDILNPNIDIWYKYLMVPSYSLNVENKNTNII